MCEIRLKLTCSCMCSSSSSHSSIKVFTVLLMSHWNVLVFRLCSKIVQLSDGVLETLRRLLTPWCQNKATRTHYYFFRTRRSQFSILFALLAPNVPYKPGSISVGPVRAFEEATWSFIILTGAVIHFINPLPSYCQNYTPLLSIVLIYTVLHIEKHEWFQYDRWGFPNYHLEFLASYLQLSF